MANWSVPDQTGALKDATKLPGAGDDVTFDNRGLVDSTVDVAFVNQIGGLRIMRTYAKTLTVNKDISVVSTNQSRIDGGTIDGTKSITFYHNQSLPVLELIWTGGTIKAIINVSAGAYASIQDAGTKTLDGGQFISSGNVSWDGKGTLALKNNPQGTALFKSLGSFTINSGVDATVDGDDNTHFWVQGTANINVAATKSITFKTRVTNFGTLVINGNVITGTIQNAGTITVQDASELTLGNNQKGILLDATDSVTKKSIINGMGKVTFASGSAVELKSSTYGPVVLASRVIDLSTLTFGSGDLVITGTYTWGQYGNIPPNTLGKWAGSGTTYVGTDTVTAATLQRGNWNAQLERKVVVYGTMVWGSRAPTDAAPTVTTLANGGGIDIKAPGVFQVIVLPVGAVPGTYKAKLVKGTNAGSLTNAGTIIKEGEGELIIEVEVSPASGGKLKGQTGTIRFPSSVQMPVGDMEISAGATIAFDAGFTQTGGTVANNGVMQITGAYAQSAGSMTVSGSGASLTAGSVAQSGSGSILVDNYASLAVAGNYSIDTATTTIRQSAASIGGQMRNTFGTLTLDNQNLVATGSLILDSGGILQAKGFSQISGNLTNSGTVRLGGIDPSRYGPGQLTVTGNYTQTAGGQLILHVGPTYNDRLIVNGAVSLAGILSVLADAGYVPAPGTTFELISYAPGARTGMFDTLYFPGNWSALYDDPAHPNSVTARVN